MPPLFVHPDKQKMPPRMMSVFRKWSNSLSRSRLIDIPRRHSGFCATTGEGVLPDYIYIDVFMSDLSSWHRFRWLNLLIRTDLMILGQIDQVFFCRSCDLLKDLSRLTRQNIHKMSRQINPYPLFYIHKSRQSRPSRQFIGQATIFSSSGTYTNKPTHFRG